MTTVYLIRHAQAEGNLYRRCHGWYNSLITQKGYRQIDALERRFSGIHFDAVYSSDLIRTMTTAQAIVRSRGLPLHTDPNLREVGCGCWEDHPWGELLQRDRDNLLAFLRCDPSWHIQDGEVFPHLRHRLHSAVDRIAAAHPYQTVAVFSHGMAIRSAIAFWLGIPLEQMGKLPLGDNTAVAKLEYTGGSAKLCYYNDSGHLGDLAGSPRRGDGSGDTAPADLSASSLWFRPLELPAQAELYLSARTDVWAANCHGPGQFDGTALLHAAERIQSDDPASILVALAGDTPVGLLEIDRHQQPDRRVGHIPFLCMFPEHRSKGLGVQLLGQAVSACRNQGHQYLRLCCERENVRARKFFEAHGFYQVGEESSGSGHWAAMEKYIGLEPLSFPHT